jgi:hypothetical protein
MSRLPYGISSGRKPYVRMIAQTFSTLQMAQDALKSYSPEMEAYIVFWDDVLERYRKYE